MYFLLKRNSLQRTPGAGAPPPEPAYTIPPADYALKADGEPASPGTAPPRTVYTTGHTERVYEADGNVRATGAPPWGPPYPIGPMGQVHEADGMASNRHELPGP
jgi:hypothetical protein